MKNEILNKINEKDIYLKYLQLDKMPNGNVSSPFCEDNKPSFKLYDNNTFKCYSSGKQGDVWQFVADIHKIDCKTQFQEVLKIINSDFSLNLNETNNHFSFVTKEFSEAHLNFWNKKNWHVNQDILNKYNVSALDKFEYWNGAKKQIAKHKIFPKMLAYVYQINNRAEIYIPSQEKASKFILNKTISDDIFGYDQLDNDLDFLIICAGKKDCLILNANGFPAVTFRSENHFPNAEQIIRLKNKAKKILICYDNDTPGQNAALKILSKYDLIHFQLPERYNDIADYFLDFDKNDFHNLFKDLLIQDNSDDEVYTIFHKVENYLKKHYNLRYNEINLDIESSKKGLNNWKSLNENSLFVELMKRDIKIPLNSLLALLRSEFVEVYNPFKNYFNNLNKWDYKTDYIKLVCDHINAEDNEQFYYHFKKWLVRAVKCALVPSYFNKQAFILVHRGQNTGKSTFCRWLCPPTLSNYIAEDITQDKDARILLCKNFLINLDELAGLNRKELTSLKSIFSKSQINERLPYDKKNSILNRVCSFIGSTNEDNFLNDETGSVRWLCFKINSINWEYSKKINIDHVWSQAYALANDAKFICEMTADDIRLNEKRNSQFLNTSSEQELVAHYVRPSNKFEGRFQTASDIIIYLAPLGLRLNKISIGKALISLGFERIKSQNGIYGYFVTYKDLFSNFDD